MGLNRLLLIILAIIGIVMIYLGIQANYMKPPILSGVGFLIIAILLGRSGGK